MTSIPAIVRVEDVHPGDEVRVGKTGMHVVSHVDRFDTLGVDELENFVVVYFATEEHTYENKARDRSGHNRRRLLVEKSIRPLERGETVLVVRGIPERAEHLQDAMQSELAERSRATEERWKRIAARDRIKAMQE